ncbi:MAG: tRNA (adenosine(37)-N6)-threonylcarbamoyltransferase complex dimerization subunit type 1 TsaB [Gammaproteobacteria bacterium]|nr:tRNA (adenosine(37)-N6)-threonylcarbamoyltransferase complex dimerization subunit type 1 TsaB [Gammaproteobacteria bacterium]
MNLLAVDTATEACSVALQIGDNTLQRYEIAPQQHAAILLPMIEEMLAEAGVTPAALDGLAFGRGPGSFTGVRIATAAVQGIALGINCGVVGVSTLAAIAHRAWREQQIQHAVSTIDARMQQVYWGCYRTTGDGQTLLLGEEQVSNPDTVRVMPGTVPADQWQAVGTGARQYTHEIEANAIACEQITSPTLPAAVDILSLARAPFANNEAEPADSVAPVYLRDKVAQTEAERNQVNAKG